MGLLIVVCVWAGGTKAIILDDAFRKVEYEKLQLRKRNSRINQDFT